MTLMPDISTNHPESAATGGPAAGSCTPCWRSVIPGRPLVPWAMLAASVGGLRHAALLVIVSAGTVAVAAADLQVIEGCTLVATDWADGDSFRVRLPSG